MQASLRVKIVGSLRSIPRDALRQVTSIIPFAPALVNQDGALHTSLGAAATRHALTADPIALRATLDGGRVISLSSRPGATVSPFKVTLPEPDDNEVDPWAGLDRGAEAVKVPDPALVHLVAVDAAPPGRVLDAIAALRHLGYQTVLHPGGLPEALEAPVAAIEQEQPGGVGGIDAPGSANARGGLAADVVGTVIKRHRPQVVSCYERALSKNPSLRGQVTLSFEIGAQGNVSKAEILESTLGADGATEVETCLIAHVRSWSFPRPTDGGPVSVSYPFVFEPSR